jgi:signal peptidase I
MQPHYQGPPEDDPEDSVAQTAEPRPERRAFRGAAWEIIETLILALLIFLAVRAVVQNFRVEGSSMSPSLQHGEHVLINKAVYFRVNLDRLDFLPFIDAGDDPVRYLFHPPERGDIIVFQAPTDESRDYIKRVVGLPGETVEIREGLVFIDGAPLEEPYIKERATYSEPPQPIPEGHYYVLGDNRNVSQDSHFFGPIPQESIIGKAWVIYWPFGKFGFAPNH